MTGIEKAIETLYEVFSRYPRPTEIESCPCGCTKPDATVHLLAVPLRELRFAGLIDYSSSAISTQGSVDDFRYFLPRLLQGIANEPYDYNPEILFGKLSYAEWRIWPDIEVTAIKNYFNALWLKGLNSFPIEEHLPAFFEIETLLASIAQTGEALEPYLQTWTETTVQEADEHLIQFVTMYGDDFSSGRTLDRAFWEESTAQAATLREWLLRPDTLQRITRAATLLRSDGYEHLFKPALVTLQNEAKVR
jgi:hypothetical protein